MLCAIGLYVFMRAVKRSVFGKPPLWGGGNAAGL